MRKILPLLVCSSVASLYGMIGIITKDVTIRENPSNKAKEVEDISKDQTIEIIKKVDGGKYGYWYQTPKGYIYEKFVKIEEINDISKPLPKEENNILNTQSDSKNYFVKGDKVLIKSCDKWGWCYLEDESGYIKKWQFKKTNIPNLLVMYRDGETYLYQMRYFNHQDKPPYNYITENNSGETLTNLKNNYSYGYFRKQDIVAYTKYVEKMSSTNSSDDTIVAPPTIQQIEIKPIDTVKLFSQEKPQTTADTTTNSKLETNDLPKEQVKINQEVTVQNVEANVVVNSVVPVAPIVAVTPIVVPIVNNDDKEKTIPKEEEKLISLDNNNTTEPVAVITVESNESNSSSIVSIPTQLSIQNESNTTKDIPEGQTTVEAKATDLESQDKNIESSTHKPLKYYVGLSFNLNTLTVNKTDQVGSIVLNKPLETSAGSFLFQVGRTFKQKYLLSANYEIVNLADIKLRSYYLSLDYKLPYAYNPYIGFSLGMSDLAWQYDPLVNSQIKDNKLSSVLYGVQTGIVIPIEDEWSFYAQAGYQKLDFKTNLISTPAKSTITHEDKKSIGGGVRVSF